MKIFPQAEIVLFSVLPEGKQELDEINNMKSLSFSLYQIILNYLTLLQESIPLLQPLQLL